MSTNTISDMNRMLEDVCTTINKMELLLLELIIVKTICVATLQKGPHVAKNKK